MCTQGSTKIKISACPLSNLHFSSTCLKLFWAQSLVNGQISHEKFLPRLPVGQVPDEICLPDRKIY